MQNCKKKYFEPKILISEHVLYFTIKTLNFRFHIVSFFSVKWQNLVPDLTPYTYMSTKYHNAKMAKSNYIFCLIMVTINKLMSFQEKPILKDRFELVNPSAQPRFQFQPNKSEK